VAELMRIARWGGFEDDGTKLIDINMAASAAAFT
jgi:hypothetical protein